MMGFGAYYVIIGLSMKAGLAESCARLALVIKIPQVKLSSVYVPVSGLAQISSSPAS